MNVARVTVNATAHGFTVLATAGPGFGSTVVVATCALLELDNGQMYTETVRSQENGAREIKIEKR
jgi:hypothetical protein